MDINFMVAKKKFLQPFFLKENGFEFIPGLSLDAIMTARNRR
ncbi:hypothetical protein CLOSTMETH_00533 [[Clostridium] methylpentosum DSM 5476]|uniref:Uncharacterized protein n=1 Tax=[Clostridium] methylpentosum DSM 5476 TaxID=537013 RepID=C0E9N4_9FIRM|nr:hypothetical protein CLOSTMETH_00533 [[Clostridium] methylpentosum DSM 5476]